MALFLSVRRAVTTNAIGAALLAMSLSPSAAMSDEPVIVAPGAVPLPTPVAVPAAAAATAVTRNAVTRIVYPSGRLPRLSLSRGSEQAVRSMLKVDHALSFGDYVWNDSGVGPGPVVIRVDLERQLVSVFRGGHEIGTALVIYGTKNNSTPVGALSVLGKVAHYRSHKYGTPMEYTLWLNTRGIAIHASEVHAGYATQGCIGVPIGFARRLYDVTQIGDKVGILVAKNVA